jgi:hypothetical protein
LTITGATETANNPALSITQTWNNGAITYDAIDLNVTATASSGASNLINLKTGGTTQFKVSRAGVVTLLAGGVTGPTIQFATGAGLYTASGNLGITSSNTSRYFFGNTAGFSTSAANYMGWSSSTSADVSIDTRLHRMSAGEIGVGTTSNNTSGKMVMSGLTLQEGAAPSTPASGFSTVYVKTDGMVYGKDDAGVETKLSNPTLTKNATIELPTASENLGMFRTPVAITVTNTHAVLVGSSTPSVTYQINFGTDRTSGTAVYSAGQTVTSTTTGTAASGVNDATIPAGSWIWITTSAQSGTVNNIQISLTYTED